MNFLKNACCMLILVLTSYAVQAQTPCAGGSAAGYPCDGIDLMSFTPLSVMGSSSANDIWGWTSPNTGDEYVILGLIDGTAFFNITDPINPTYLGKLSTQTSNSDWRDIKVHNNHAFIVSEAGNHGMQVFNLSQLDGLTTAQTWSNTAYFNGSNSGITFGNAHNIVINEASGYAYIVGSQQCNEGLYAVDISNPTNPVFAGCFGSDGYTHDAQCVNYIGPDPQHQGTEICFNSNEDTFTIVDVSDKTDMTQISRTGYNGSRYTHQGWLTEDHEYYLMNDELDESGFGHNTRTYMWDVRDLDNPTYLGFYEATNASIDHNLYIKGNLAYCSNYRSGLRVLDVSNIASGSLTEFAYFDTYPSSNSSAFTGTWSNYPYFASGVIAVSDIEGPTGGLFLLKLQDAACLDGVQNNGETGVDCGGICAACPTCNDGILNGNETAADCGGPDCATCPPESCPAVDFNASSLVSYDAGDNDQGTGVIQDGGATAFITSNGWKATTINYTITASTVLEFEFKSTQEGEIHEVGFDNDLVFAPDVRAVVYGNQGFAGDFNNATYTGSGNWETFVIDLGANGVAGTFQYLVLSADDDATGNGNSYFRNIKIYEDSDNNLLCDSGVSCAGVDLSINFDGAPTQTSWEITDASGATVASSGGNVYAAGLANSNLVLPDVSCLADGCYDLTFMDSGNDGMCPRRTTTVLTGINIANLGLGGVFNGSPRLAAEACGDYTLTDVNGTVLASGGGRFGTSETTNFCISGGVAQLLQPTEDWEAKISDGVISGLEIQPNIVDDNMTVIFTLEEATDAELFIIDMNGKTLGRYTQNANDTQQVEMNVSELAAGFYFVRLVSGDATVTRKFVKN